MPRNNQTVPRAERIAAVLDGATRLFLEHGFDTVKMTDIAAEAGIKSGALYWYFQSKDHLLAAALRRLVDDEVERLAELPANVGPADRFVRLLTDLSPIRPLHASAHARMDYSVEVAEAHTFMVETLRSLASAALVKTGVTEVDALAVDSIVAAFEGANLQGPWNNGPLKIVQFLLQQLDSEYRTVPGSDME